jgi:hypothetical protein
MDDTILVYNQLKELGIIQDNEYIQNILDENTYKIDPTNNFLVKDNLLPLQKKIEILLGETDIYKNNQYKDNQLDTYYKKNKIMLNFTSLFDKGANSDKKYQEICIHTPSTDKMDEFMISFNNLLKETGFKKIGKLDYKMISKQPDWIHQLEWLNMPSFVVNDELLKCVSITILIERTENEKRRKFMLDMIERFELKITDNTTSLWFPARPLELSPHKNKMWICDEMIKNKYPIYVISKGRWEKRLTQRYLEWSGLDYLIVVEPSEYEEYSKVIPHHKILVCPEDFSKRGEGGIPVRNFVWRHSIDLGAKRHWILDDNIVSYKRCNDSERTLVKGGVAFRAVEDFVDRFTDVKMSGHNYTMFAITSNTKLKPVVYNSRCYSSILLSNDLITDGLIEEGWRGRYNEDTDLSLRILKAGFPTALINSFAAEKLKTLTQKGGNTDTIYAVKDALLLKAQSLQEQHPDCAEITERFGRTHHYVNYKQFKKMKPTYKDGVKETLTDDPYEYTMTLTDLDVSWKAPK